MGEFSITMAGLSILLITLVGCVLTPVRPHSVNTLDSPTDHDTRGTQCCGEGPCLCSCGPCHQYCCTNLRCHSNECIPQSSCSREGEPCPHPSSCCPGLGCTIPTVLAPNPICYK